MVIVFPFSWGAAWPLTYPARNGVVSCFNLVNFQKLSVGNMSTLPLSASRLYATYERYEGTWIYKQFIMWGFHDLLTFYSIDRIFSLTYLVQSLILVTFKWFYLIICIFYSFQFIFWSRPFHLWFMIYNHDDGDDDVDRWWWWSLWWWWCCWW